MTIFCVEDLEFWGELYTSCCFSPLSLIQILCIDYKTSSCNTAEFDVPRCQYPRSSNAPLSDISYRSSLEKLSAHDPLLLGNPWKAILKKVLIISPEVSLEEGAQKSECHLNLNGKFAGRVCKTPHPEMHWNSPPWDAQFLLLPKVQVYLPHTR